MNPNDLQLEDVFDSDFVDEVKVLYNYKIHSKIVLKYNRKNVERGKSLNP